MTRGKGAKRGAEKGADEYEFADNDLEERLVVVGKKLKALGTAAPSGKDALIKLLKAKILVNRFGNEKRLHACATSEQLPVWCRKAAMLICCVALFRQQHLCWRRRRSRPTANAAHVQTLHRPWSRSRCQTIRTRWEVVQQHACIGMSLRHASSY